jgi:hypothetical protein
MFPVTTAAPPPAAPRVGSAFKAAAQRLLKEIGLGFLYMWTSDPEIKDELGRNVAMLGL